ncbi:MAG: PspC domain-containing protein [Jatrophihabitans sp.]|nr:MAG: PspC domain-containing protein [Jatrophihabitans sp.]
MTDTTVLPPHPTTPPPGQRVLRRSRTDRVGAGVAGGLGAYFGVDPVLFRVLFAVAAFFGGAGVLAYLVAWAAIPDEGEPNAPVDRFVAGLRTHRVPVWLAAVVAGLVLWALAFSWWAPGPFFPVILVVLVLVAVFSRRGGASTPAQPAAPAAGPVDLRKDGAGGPGATDPGATFPGATFPGAADPGARDLGAATRSWVAAARAASAERRRRAFPVRITVLIALVLTLVSLGIADAVGGVRLPVYFWVTLGIVGAGLLVGLALRRTPWSMTALLIPALVGTIAFGNTGASLHDGVGRKDWTPLGAAHLAGDYRLAFGQGNLDLSRIGDLGSPRTVEVTMAAGQAVLTLPRTLNATVYANVRIGAIEVDNAVVASTRGGSFHRINGYDIERTVLPPDGASGAALTIVVHLADGQISVRRT